MNSHQLSGIGSQLSEYLQKPARNSRLFPNRIVLSGSNGITAPFGWKAALPLLGPPADKRSRTAPIQSGTMHSATEVLFLPPDHWLLIPDHCYSIRSEIRCATGMNSYANHGWP